MPDDLHDPGPTRAPLGRRAFLTLGGLSAVTACSARSEAAPPAPASPALPAIGPRPVGRVRRPEDSGAVGDGRTDDTAALQRALAALRPGEQLLLTPGRTYLHRDVLTVTVPGVLLGGRGTLLATDESRSSLQVDADRVWVVDLALGVRHTTRRWSAPAQHRLYVGRRRGVVVQGVRVTGSAAAGVFLAGASEFLLGEVQVSDTRADGVHMTQGTAHGLVRAPHVSRSGDDAVAVVSYLEDGVICSDLRVLQPRVDTTTGGRGLSVVGGQDITYGGIDVRGSAAAGVYLACEGDPYNTYGTRRVQVLGGSVQGANTDRTIDHGSVLVYSGRGGGVVADTTLVDLRVRRTRPTASRQVGVISLLAPARRVRMTGFDVDAAPTPLTRTDPASCTATGWTVAGTKHATMP